MDVNERLRGYKRLDYDGRDCILVPLEDPLARRIQEEKLCAHQWNPNGFLIVDRDQLAKALESGAPYRWESPEQKRRRLGHYESQEDINKEIANLTQSIEDARRDLAREEREAGLRGDSFDQLSAGEWGRLNKFIEETQWQIDDLKSGLSQLEVVHIFESSEDIHCDLTLDKLLKEAQN